eukprot:447533-Amphidinium_carterae.2
MESASKKLSCLCSLVSCSGVGSPKTCCIAFGIRGAWRDGPQQNAWVSETPNSKLPYQCQSVLNIATSLHPSDLAATRVPRAGSVVLSGGIRLGNWCRRMEF